MKLLELLLKRTKYHETYKCPICDKRMNKLINVFKHIDKKHS